MNNLQKLRDALQDLTYSDMMIFASWFANTEKSDDRIDDESFWAYVINDWAHNAEIGDEEKPNA